jgi:uncharacterized phage-associated protein
MKNSITVLDIAHYFIALANESGSLLTNRKLQKLLYYTQAWHLAMYEKPIFEEDFEAWAHGPVLPSVFEYFDKFGYSPIQQKDLDDVTISTLQVQFGADLTALIENVVEEYFWEDAYQLGNYIQAEKPFQFARKGVPSDAVCHNIITKQSMLHFYKQHLTTTENEETVQKIAA